MILITRTKIKDIKPTLYNQLKKIEQQIVQANIRSFGELKDWLGSNHFKLLLLTGEAKGCDYQYYRQIGVSRYHWRIYLFYDKIVIESHIDKHDPGRGFTKNRTLDEIANDFLQHIHKDVLQPVDHRYIILARTNEFYLKLFNSLSSIWSKINT